MAKKSKEIEIGGFRVQIDPLILVRRILTRQKLLLAIVAILGGLATAVTYVRTPKKYTSTAEIVIRAEVFQEDYLRKLLNVVARYVGSDTEMMLIINELNLYAATRASLPYDIALRDMRRELKIDRPGSSIVISFQSKSPQEAQRVVAFVTERMMTKLADLKDSPFRQQLDAIQTGLDDVMPRLKKAQLEAFEFREKHPEVAIRVLETLAVGSPMAGVQAQIDKAQNDMKRCFGGAVEAATKPKRRNTPACMKLSDALSDKKAMLEQFTPNHPSVIAQEAKIRDLQATCDRDQDVADENSTGIRPGMSQAECIAATKGRIQELTERKLQLETTASKKPKLERRWAELSLELNALDTEWLAYRETFRKVNKERLLAANEFRDSFVLVDPPRIPELPSYPDRNQFMMIGMALTFVVGVFLATAREALRQTFVDSREVEEQTGIAVLAVLPNISDDA